ncbi:MAG: type II toxin-antitoxin system HicB family antitoxin [Candidatus Zixiibacteriota bacterium]|jgi:predicted RNase H-like HicB family nuclease
MFRRYNAVITQEGKWFVARCIELGVVSQGETVEEAQANLKEAVDLYIESFGDEDLPEGSGSALMYQMEVAVGA